MAAAATYKSLRNLILLMSAALAAAPLANAQDLIEIVKIDVVVPDRPAANTTLYPGQDNVWDIQISEVFRVFVTYRLRMGTDTIGNVVLVQHRTDTGEDLISDVTAPLDGSGPPGHVYNKDAPTAITQHIGPGGNGLGLRVARRDTFDGFAPALEYRLVLITNVTADSHLNPLAESGVIRVGPPDGADYEITGIEVVQAVQDSAGSVPLVANKPTAARVYIQAVEGSITGNDRVSARLSARQVGGARLGGISPRFRHRFVRPTGAANPPDRNKATSSLLFVFPDSWTEPGRLTLTAEIDFETTPLSDDLGNNIARTGVAFTEKSPLTVRYLPICVQDRSGQTLCPQPHHMTFQDFLAEEMFPLPEDGIRYVEGSEFVANKPFVYSGPFPIELVGTGGDIHARINLAVVTSFLAPFALNFAKASVISGLGADADAFALFLPKGTRFTTSANEVELEDIARFLPFDREPRAFLMSADPSLQGEVAFAAGLAGTLGAEIAYPACMPFKPKAWPNEEGTIEATAPEGSQDAVGFDTPALELKPSSLRDFTSGCAFDDVWISGLNATTLFRLFPGPSSALEPEEETWQSTGEVLLALANFRTDGSSAAIESASRLAGDPPGSPASQGDYCLEIHDGNGTFAQECFGAPESQFVDAPVLEEFQVSSALPLPPDATAIRLTYRGNVLLERTPSVAAPTVNITAPSPGDRWEGGEQTIAWDAADADGDALSYDVFASTDGGASWQPVSIGLDDTEATLDGDLLDSAKVQFRVTANDGFHSTEAVVGPVTIATTPQIDAPGEVDLGFAVVEDFVNAEVRIANSGQGRLEIQEASVDNPSFEILGLPEPFRILAGTDAPLRIRYLPTAAGVETAVLTIRSNAAEQPQLTVNLRAEGVDAETPTIAVSRRMLDLGEVASNQRVAGTVTVTSTGFAELVVEAAVSGAGFSLDAGGPFTLTPGEQQAAVGVAFSGGTPGVFAGALILTSNDPNQPRIEVPLSATVIEGDGGPGAGGPQPSISAGGVRNAATFQPGMVQGSWVTIFGENLADSTRTWDGAINGLVLPTELDGVRVLIGGKAAAVFFISPGQLNVQVPDGLTPGPVDVQVIVNGVPGAALRVDLREVSPGFFLFDPDGRKYLAAVHLDGVFAGRDGLFGPSLQTRPVRPGERVLLFGTGFGATIPPTPAGVIPSVAPTAETVVVTVGGRDAVVEFAGIVGAGLYQFNVIIPEGLAAGDAEVVATVSGQSSPAGAFLTVGL